MTEQKSPKDANIITAVLKDLGITEYEPKVVHQLLEFTNRYISGVLDDARAISLHAKKKTIEPDDIKLAISMQQDRQVFTTPPSRDAVLEVARLKNEVPLPAIKPQNGIRLPPDRYCTTSANYKLKQNLRETNGGKYMLSNTSSIRSSGLGNIRRTANMTTIGRQTSQSKGPSIIKLSSQSMPKAKIQVTAGDSNGSNSPTVQVKVIDSQENKTETMELD